MPNKPRISPVELFDNSANELSEIDQEYVPIEASNEKVRDFREEINEAVLMLRNHLRELLKYPLEGYPKLKPLPEVRAALQSMTEVDGETMVHLHNLKLSIEDLAKMVRKYSSDCISGLNEGLGGGIDDESLLENATNRGLLDVDLGEEADELDHSGDPDDRLEVHYNAGINDGFEGAKVEDDPDDILSESVSVFDSNDEPEEVVEE